MTALLGKIRGRGGRHRGEVSNHLFDPDLNTMRLCPSLAASWLLISHQDPLPPNSQVSCLNIATLKQMHTHLVFTHSI